MPSSSTPVVCVDASFIVQLVTDVGDRQLRAVWRRWQEEGREAVAPALVFFEVTNALYRLGRHGFFGPAAVTAALQAALALPLQLHVDPTLHHQAIKLARQLGLPACYDAHYLALAERLGAELWTCDHKLARAVAQQLPWVHAAGTRH
jgi:predicted nucleic acid-binding protein